MDNPDQPVLVRQMTAFFLSVAMVVEGMIRASNIDRTAVLAFIQKAVDDLPAEQRVEMLATFLRYWHQVIARGPGIVPPPSVH